MTQYISNRFTTDRAITFLNESNQIGILLDRSRFT